LIRFRPSGIGPDQLHETFSHQIAHSFQPFSLHIFYKLSFITIRKGWQFRIAVNVHGGFLHFDMNYFSCINFKSFGCVVFQLQASSIAEYLNFSKDNVKIKLQN
jgi:hypothetical protein